MMVVMVAGIVVMCGRHDGGRPSSTAGGGSAVVRPIPTVVWLVAVLGRCGDGSVSGVVLIKRFWRRHDCGSRRRIRVDCYVPVHRRHDPGVSCSPLPHHDGCCRLGRRLLAGRLGRPILLPLNRRRRWSDVLEAEECGLDPTLLCFWTRRSNARAFGLYRSNQCLPTFNVAQRRSFCQRLQCPGRDHHALQPPLERGESLTVGWLLGGLLGTSFNHLHFIF